MPEITSLRELAIKCRKLAAQIDDEPTVWALRELAQEYDRQAEEALQARDPDEKS